MSQNGEYDGFTISNLLQKAFLFLFLPSSSSSLSFLTLLEVEVDGHPNAATPFGGEIHIDSVALSGSI